MTSEPRLSLPRPRRPRLWLAAGIALLLVVAAGVVAVVLLDPHRGCVDEAVDHPHSPLLTPQGMQARPDERLDTLRSAVSAMGPPFGNVIGGVGYDYDQWLHLYAVEGGLLAFTKNNAPVTLLDPHSLRARWALRPGSRRTAWDASGDRFLLLDLAASRPTTVSAYGMADGKAVWCTDLAQHHRDGQPVATTFLPGDDVLVALPSKHGVTVSRLADDDGHVKWDRAFDTVDRADYLGVLSDDLVVAGGSEEHRLADQAPTTRGGDVVTAFDAGNGSPAWTWRAAPDTVVHIAGTTEDQVLLVERGPDGTRVIALDDHGEEAWTMKPADLAFESTLRGDVLLMRSRAGLDAYAATDGHRLWHQAIPADRTFFPYGFTLDQMPSLDDEHLLVPTTTDLRVLDVRDGTERSYPLPVDGLGTTYWPYQLLATPDLLGVVTNTGAVVAEREPVDAPRPPVGSSG